VRSTCETTHFLPWLDRLDAKSIHSAIIPDDVGLSVVDSLCNRISINLGQRVVVIH